MGSYNPRSCFLAMTDSARRVDGGAVVDYLTIDVGEFGKTQDDITIFST